MQSYSCSVQVFYLYYFLFLLEHKILCGLNLFHVTSRIQVNNKQHLNYQLFSRYLLNASVLSLDLLLTNRLNQKILHVLVTLQSTL